jgi:GMP synthase (glutamine-hydrolysing)
MDEKVVVIKHVEQEGGGLIEDYFRNEGWAVQVVELERGEPLPADVAGFAALIVLGGPMSVYQKKAYPFLSDEENLIRKALVDEVPLLGICLGAQLLAKTCGARVRKAPQNEVGWHHVRLTREGRRDILFRGSGDGMVVFQWHEDTFDMPKGGMLLAEGHPCRNQAFKIGSNAYGLQFHIEVTTDMVKSWMEGEKDKIDMDRILKDAETMKADFQGQTGVILGNFARLIQSSLRYKRIIKQFIEDGKWNDHRAINWWEMGQ